MFISWSVEGDQDVSDRTRDVLGKFKSDMLEQTEVILMPSEEGRLQQFQHYERIKDRMGDMSSFGERTFLMFSDDDDIWDSRRVGEAMKILRVMDSSQSCCMRLAGNMPGNQRGYDLGKNHLARAADVTKDIEDKFGGVAEGGGVKHELRQAEDGQPYCMNYFEYLQFCVPLSRFTEFFARFGPKSKLFEHPQCDTAFSLYIESAPCVMYKWVGETKGDFHVRNRGEPWMYFYNMGVELAGGLNAITLYIA